MFKQTLDENSSCIQDSTTTGTNSCLMNFLQARYDVSYPHYNETAKLETCTFIDPRKTAIPSGKLCKLMPVTCHKNWSPLD